MSIPFVTLILIILSISYFGLYANSLYNVHAQLAIMPTVKITSPTVGEQVDILDNKTIFRGISSDNVTSNCQVTVILNNIKPYQPTKPGSPSDYSTWTLDQSPYYVNMKEGQNKLTSKISCLASPTNLTKWYSVNFTGVVDSGANNNNQSGQSGQNKTFTNSNQTENMVLSAKEQMRQLSVRVQADKNPVFLGDPQTFTLTVSDAVSHIPVSNAEIKGVVTLPSGKSKEFSVATDVNGQGFYTFRTGEVAEPGKTNLIFRVTSSGYDPLDVRSTSEIKANSPTNPFDERINLFNLPLQPKRIFG
ncbi:MAG TPA: hypothetical protein VH415_16750 [Nitrososphaeraceae archaeon]|jgi:hypothetical protein